MKKQVSNLILASVAIFSIAFIGTAAAQSNSASSGAFSHLTYPIAELGSCKDRNDCKIYCDDSANTVACISYAEKKSLLSQEDLQVAKNFIASGSKGPGDCTGKKECQTFCEDKNHIDECVSYAEDKGLMSGQELQKAKKVQAAIKKGVKFPSCNTKKECDAYCEEPGHMEECVAFAQKAGLLSDEELQNTQKVLTAVKQGVKPPACKGKDACDSYCAEASHAEECVNFAVVAGIVTSDQARIIKETGGRGPGGCKNKSECDAYCGNADNRQTCMSFAKEHNILQPEPPQQPGQPKQDGTGPGNGTDQGQGGPGAGTGPGNGAGQGGGSGPNQGQGFNPGSGQGGNGQNNPNPVKCIEDCENVGNTCTSQVDNVLRKDCRAKGEYCRKVTCDVRDADGNQLLNEVEWHQCSDQCATTIETPCNNDANTKWAACMTTKNTCITQCQKASKPTKPTRPNKPTEPTRPSQPSQSGQPSEPSRPSQPSQPSRPDQSGPGVGGQPKGGGKGNGGGGSGGQGPGISPTKCSQDCALTGNNCLSPLDAETKACPASAESCRQSCAKQYENIQDDETRMMEQRNCSLKQCDPIEASCHNVVQMKQSACTTTKDTCVMQCQKASKPTKPTQPTKPTEPTRPNQPSQPGQPSEPLPPSQPGQPGQMMQPPSPPQPPSPSSGPN